VIIAVVILMPEGIVGSLRTLWNRVRHTDEEEVR
jgi:branched-chain amino acid transport system permease protein